MINGVEDMENRVSVKEYAAARGISIQAVHKSMAGKRKSERLQGHVEIIDGVKWLDEEAVRILDESRSKAPVVILEDSRTEEMEALRNRIRELEERIEHKDILYERLQERLDRREMALEDANRKLMAIEDKHQAEINEATEAAESRKEEELTAMHSKEVEDIQKQHQDELQAVREEYEKELKEERSKTIWRRLIDRLGGVR